MGEADPGPARPRRARRSAAALQKQALGHNLAGQRLGRKGRDTRERILTATRELLATPPGEPISLSAVARQASLGMSSLYLYFNDLTELLLAVLDPIMASAEDAYLGRLRVRWPDDALAAHCFGFVNAYYGFWESNARILHLRNQLTRRQDKRMMVARVAAAQPVITLLVAQMDQDPALPRTPAYGMATVLYTGIDRVVTIATDKELPTVLPGEFSRNVKAFLQSEARLLELGIRDYRALAREEPRSA